jgi:hypothetical protein
MFAPFIGPFGWLAPPRCNPPKTRCPSEWLRSVQKRKKILRVMALIYTIVDHVLEARTPDHTAL